MPNARALSLHCSRLLVAAALSAPALAREPDEGSIIVTARRIDERGDQVPLSVSSIPAREIGAGGVDSLQSLATRTPGLSFEAIWGGANSFPILRGQNQPSVAGDSVGMFVDGVYQPNRDAIDIMALDLERIEVVHGPQSALFGHSTLAGLIHFVPAKPDETLSVKASADLASNNSHGISGTVSGPVSALFKARVAASYKSAESTYANFAVPGQRLGKSRQLAIAATLATRDNSGPLSARLSARYGESRSNQPAFFTLDSADFNCGARDPASGVWSYFCGAAPIESPAALSSDIPESLTRTGQIALHLALDLGGVELRSDTSYIRASSDAFRDFDGSADGDVYGVCASGLNCSGIGSITIPVMRLQRVNIVQRRSLSSREIAQELRLRSTGEGRLDWQIGAALFASRLQTQFAYGAQRGSLAANERFSSLVLANPQRVGPLAAINNALADDPGSSQTLQNDTVESRRTIALFGTGEYRLQDSLRLRGELRLTWERLEIDNRLSNFAPSFGTSLGQRPFHDVTPRVSLDWRPMPRLLAYASYARGSHSGGINPVANLLAGEQTYEPETNWTAELGVKYSGQGLLRSASATLYDINWRSTQILGLATTPGVTALITRNTSGVHTQGFELGLELAPARWLDLNFAWSHTNPRFKAGSEDPGSGAFCGISASNAASSFCTIRPSTIAPGQLVPDVSGNLLLRAVPDSWAGGVTIMPQAGLMRGIRLHAGISHQGNDFERAINGLYFGARTLLDARVSIPLGRFSFDLWGTNLANYRYIRAGAGRQPQFYIGIPRPTDLILGEGRQIGLTLRYER